jgi:hypothetical protein
MIGTGVGFSLNHMKSASTLTEPRPAANGAAAGLTGVWAAAAPAMKHAVQAAAVNVRTTWFSQKFVRARAGVRLWLTDRYDACDIRRLIDGLGPVKANRPPSGVRTSPSIGSATAVIEYCGHCVLSLGPLSFAAGQDHDGR